jgi:hypothetical protein
VPSLSSSRSLRRAYLDWVDEQIEEFKDSVSHSALLDIADDVVTELGITRSGQYQLTELLLWNAVDRKIFRLLQLPGYRSWRRAQLGAQRTTSEEPAHPATVDLPPLLSLCVETTQL